MAPILRPRNKKFKNHWLETFCPILFFVFGVFSAAAAQSLPPPITSSGLNTQVNPAPTSPSGTVQYDITGGTRPGGGANLFHSFGDFNVPTNNIANFLNAGSVDLNGTLLPPNLPTSNILGRVDGGNPSTIFGTIQTANSFGNANLFLMNPYGFLFGPTATVNVGGMVTFTTADSIRLTDDARFSAIAGPSDLLLSAAPVAAFGFLGSNPAAIAIRGSTLEVAQGQTLSFVGGNQGFMYTDPDTAITGSVPGGVTMTGGKLSAPGGQVNLASVASPGDISTVDLVPISGMTMGNISLSQGSQLDVSFDAAGTVRIRGGQFVMTDATISADTGNSNGVQTAVDFQVIGDISISNSLAPAITARTSGTGDAGKVRISSGSLTTTATSSDILSVIDTHTLSGGKAGNVSITTNTLLVNGNPNEGISVFIDSGFTGFQNGHGGDVAITAKHVTMNSSSINTGDFTALVQGGDGNGSAGNIAIVADALQLGFASIHTDAGNAGVAGDITFTRANNITLDSSQVTAVGFERGGTITVETSVLSTDNTLVESGTFLQPSGGVSIVGNVVELSHASSVASSTGGDGDAGSIRITANDHLTLSGFLQSGPIGRPTGIFSNSFGVVGVDGNAGSIFIDTPSLMMTDGARINTTTLANGSGGDVIINAQSVSLSGEFPSLIPEPLFSAGTVHAGGITTVTTGESCLGQCGNAGNVSITTNSLAIGSGAQINSGTSSSGNGGLITVNARDTISMSGILTDGSPVGMLSLSAGTTSNSGSGGSIALTAGQSVTISNGASVSASSTGPGNTGNIQIDASNQFVMTDSSVTTEANLASGGAIKITTTPNGTVQLTNSTISASVLDGTGGGGSVNIDPQFVILQNSQILAQAVRGPGGNISITTNLLLPDANSLISASSQFGVNGTVTIQSPNAPGSGQVQPLGKSPLLPTSLLTQRCAALAGGEFSSFTVAGQDSLPTEPSSWLASPLVAFGAGVGEGIGVPSAGLETMTLGGSPADKTLLLSLRQIAPAGFLTQAFAVDRSASCTS